MISGLSAHVLPRAKARKRAHLLSQRALLYYIACSLTLLIGLRVFAASKPGVLGYASNIAIKDLLNYTNDERLAKGLANLKLDEDLNAAATAKAKDMFSKNYWAHVSPDGTEPWHFFSLVDYDYLYAGENLAKNFNDSKSVVQAWMESPSHRDNILNKNYSQIGFAVVNGTLNGYQTTLVVQFFGQRRTGAPVIVTDDGVAVTEVVQPQVKPQTQQAIPFNPSIQAPLLDVYALTKTFSLVLSSFLMFMFTVDFWYSSSRGVVKINGHTLAHMLLLLMSIIAIGLVMVPGKIG